MLKDKAITAVKTAIAASLVWPVIVGLLYLTTPANSNHKRAIDQGIPLVYTGTVRYENREPDRTTTKVEKCEENPDCKLLAEVVVYEARGESTSGQIAVAYVVKNRSEHSGYPDTIKGVVYQKHQFSYLGDKHSQKIPTENDWFKAYEVAYKVLNEEVADPTKGATHYYNPSKVNPRWANKLKHTVSIGDHRFLRQT